MVDLAVFVLGSGPGFPAEGFFDDGGVFFIVEPCICGALIFEGVEMLEEEEPGGLLGVVELGGATGFLAQDVVDVFENLLKH